MESVFIFLVKRYIKMNKEVFDMIVLIVFVIFIAILPILFTVFNIMDILKLSQKKLPSGTKNHRIYES